MFGANFARMWTQVICTREVTFAKSIFLYKTCKGYITGVKTTAFIVDINLKNIVGADFSKKKTDSLESLTKIVDLFSKLFKIFLAPVIN